MHNVMGGPRGHETLLAPACVNARTVYRGYSKFVIPACLKPESSSVVISGKPLAPGSGSWLKHAAGTAGVRNANLLRALLQSSATFERPALAERFWKGSPTWTKTPHARCPSQGILPDGDSVGCSERDAGIRVLRTEHWK